MPTAYTRAPSPLLAHCQLTHVTRVPIEPARAALQHAAYEAGLAACGCRVVRMPALPDAPDGVFVEDTAILLDGAAIVTRPGAATRVAETASVRACLAADFNVVPLPYGRLDGGDVLRVGRTMYVGLSTRTDADGVGALRAVAGVHGLDVVAVPVRGCLHLKTGVTWLGADDAGRDCVLINPDWIDPAHLPELHCIAVHATEKWAANTLRIGGIVLMAEGSPRTQAAVVAHGYTVTALDIGELQKAEAGLTCMSLIG